MTKEEIEQKIEGATLSRSENNGFWHVHVRREHIHPYRFSSTLPDNPPLETVEALARDVEVWWAHTIADQPIA